MSEKEEMKNDMVKDLTALLMEKTPSLNMNGALSLVFNSDIYRKVHDDKTGLYYQSPLYVFSFLENELETGKIG